MDEDEIDAAIIGEGDIWGPEDEDEAEDVNDGERGISALGEGDEDMIARESEGMSRLRELREAACPWLEGCE